MQLIRSSGTDIDDPSDRDIDEALADVEDDSGSFVILADGDDYIQASGQLPNGLVVEYQEDGTLYRSRSHSHTLDTVRDTFAQYHRRSPDWKGAYKWEEVERGGGGCAGLLLGLLLMVAATVVGGV